MRRALLALAERLGAPLLGRFPHQREANARALAAFLDARALLGRGA